MDIISKYEAPLEASPGFFNQFKAIINGMVKNLTGTKDFLPVDKTVIGRNDRFQRIKENIQKIKDNNEKTILDTPDSRPGPRR